MKNVKERNSVDLFSDYGLDERQKAISAKLGADMFKALFNAVIVITVIWTAVYGAFPQCGIHFTVVMSSYFAVAIIIKCIYAVIAAQNGVINGITAFSYTTMSFVGSIACAAAAILLFALNSQIAINGYLLGGMLILAAVENFVLYLCGKKNFSVIDKDENED